MWTYSSAKQKMPTSPSQRHNPTSYKKNYCYLLVLRHSVRIFEITHGRLIHTGILTLIHILWQMSEGVVGWQSLELVDKYQSLSSGRDFIVILIQLCFCQGVKKSDCGRQGFQLCFCQGVKKTKMTRFKTFLELRDNIHWSIRVHLN